MKVERANEHLRPAPISYVTVKEMGNITEVRFMTNDMGAVIQKIDKDRYRNLITGQVLEYKHGTKRTDNIKNVAQSLKRLREIINTNVTDTRKCLWATLTYAEAGMSDSTRLYEDYRKFNMRFQRYLRKNNLPSCEYIVCAEFMGNGRYHLHIIYLFPSKRPYIPKADFEKLWGLGFVNIKSLKGIDNLGMYLSAYLSNIQLDSKESENSSNKRIIKGGRLHLYPKGFRIYRLSKGIKRPTVYKTTEKKAMERLKNAVLIHEKTIELSNENGFSNTINYRTFNFNKKAKKFEEGKGYDYEQDKQ